MERLNFEIIETPIYYGDLKQESVNHKGIVRNDNGNLLSIMSDSYYPLKMSEFNSITDRLANISGFELEKQQEFKGGKIVLSYLKNNVGTNKIGDFDIKDYMVLGNSFDGTSQIFIGTSTILLRCQNQFSRISQQNRIRHTATAPIKLEELVKSIEVYINERTELYTQFNKWNETRITPDLVKLAIERVVDWDNEEDNSARKINRVELIKKATQEEVNAVGMNMFGLLNGFTKYSTHMMNKDTSKNSFGSIVGNTANFNTKAYNVLKQLEYA